MRANRPTVWVVVWSVPEEAWLEGLRSGVARIRLDTPAWRLWLDGVGVSFAYPVFNPRCGYIEGFMTVRSERRQRGGRYWTVYRRCGTRVRKVYVGAAAAVTNARLSEIARGFLDEKEVDQPAAQPTIFSS